MNSREKSIEILEMVAAKSGNKVDITAARRAIQAEISEYSRRVMSREEFQKLNSVKKVKRRTATSGTEISYDDLSRALTELTEQYHGIWRDIETDIFLGTGEDVDKLWNTVEQSLAFHRCLIDSARRYARKRGREPGSLVRCLIEGLIEVFEFHTGTKAAFSRAIEPEADKGPYGEVIDFINAAIFESRLEGSVMKPRAKMLARKPNAISDISENIAKIIQRRREREPGKAMAKWKPDPELELIIADQAANISN